MGHQFWGPQINLGQINLPECEGRISGEFAELMTASCRAAVRSVEDLVWLGPTAKVRGVAAWELSRIDALKPRGARGPTQASQPLTEE